MITPQEAKINICNDSDNEILSIDVVHKYSDIKEYKTNYSVEGEYQTGMCTAPMDVKYNTGFGTTGVDWWMVTWVTADGTVYITCPNNYRDIIDVLSVNGPKILDGITAFASLFAVVGPDPVSKTAAGLVAAAAAITKSIADPFLNEEKTEGFKMHTLRAEDANDENFIHIKNDKVIFSSPSGYSSTNIATRLEEALMNNFK